MDDSDAQASSNWPELEMLAQPARERRRLPPETRSRIILALCALSPLSVKELSNLLDRSEAYVGDAIRPLVSGGALTFLYPDQPRHPKQKYITAQAEAMPAPESSPAQVVDPARAIIDTPVPSREPTAMPTPGPSPVRVADRSRVPAPDPASDPAPVPTAKWRLINFTVVLATGILLATLEAKSWLLYALLTAFGLSLAHIIANSSQYTQFLDLQASHSKRGLAFLLLKSSVAVIEIIIVYYATSVIAS